jgi:hypothetical protein
MRANRLFAIALLFGALGAARAENWTNQAGRVIEGRLAKFDGLSVTLVRTNGVTVRLPLSALCKADQQRVLIRNDFSIAPGFVVAAYKDAVLVLEKYQRLPPEQQTAEARKAAVQMACAVFDGRLRARRSELTDKAVQDEVTRLRAVLAAGE